MFLKEWMTKQIPLTFIHWKSLRSPKQSMLLLKPFSGGLYLTYSRISLQQSSLMGEKMTVNGVIFLPFTEEWQSFFLFWASYQSTFRCRRSIAASEFSIFIHTISWWCFIAIDDGSDPRNENQRATWKIKQSLRISGRWATSIQPE